MRMFKGFKTKAEAQDFIKKNGRGSICYKKSKIEKRGKNKQDYIDCIMYGGLNPKYPYAVTWFESQM